MTTDVSEHEALIEAVLQKIERVGSESGIWFKIKVVLCKYSLMYVTSNVCSSDILLLIEVFMKVQGFIAVWWFDVSF